MAALQDDPLCCTSVEEVSRIDVVTSSTIINAPSTSSMVSMRKGSREAEEVLEGSGLGGREVEGCVCVCVCWGGGQDCGAWCLTELTWQQASTGIALQLLPRLAWY